MTFGTDTKDAVPEETSVRVSGARSASVRSSPEPSTRPRAASGPAALPVLVLGYGNTLRRDDGVGVRVAERLAHDPRLVPEIQGGRLTVSTAHQLTPEVALDFAAASLVVLVDADMAELPGAIAVRELAVAEPGDVEGGGPGSRSHHVAAGELIALARELVGATPRAVSIGIGVADLELGDGLSGPVEAAVPKAVELVVGLVEQQLQG